MNKYKIIFFAVALSSSLYAQEEPSIEVEMPLESITPQKKWGKNRTHYLHTYINLGVGSNLDSREGLSNRVFSSWDFNFGVRYKLRLNNTFALNSDIFFGGQTFVFKVDKEAQQVLYPTIFKEITHERWDFGQIALAQGIRINFGKRGNHIGKFLDFGVFGQFNSRSDYTYVGTSIEDQNTNLTIREGEKIRSIDLERANNPSPFYDRGGLFSYGFYTRLGINRYAIASRYLIAGDFQMLTIGFELGIF
jgi:hypothetical protein